MMILKRSMSFLLALVMLFTMVPVNAFAAEETTEVVTEVGKVEELAETTPPEEEEILPQAEGTGEIPVTRAQWLQLLVQTFDYSIEDEIVPDNYFPDLLPEAEYYNDILIAVYYGLVDLLPNENINPDGAATREFAAYTLNACMGYLPQEESYSFSEAATATYPDDIQVAIDRGWFALENGAFNPDAPITLAEKDLMMADAESYLADMEIESGHESAYTFKEGVIEVTEEVSMNLDAQGLTITIPSLNYTLNPGDKIVVYQGGLAVPYQVESAAIEGRALKVRVTDLYFEDAIESMNAQMVTDTDPANFYAAEDTELIFIEESTGEELTQQQVIDARLGGSTSVYIPKFEGKLQVTDGFNVKVSVELKNSKVVYKVDVQPLKAKAEAQIYLDTDATVTASMNAELKSLDNTSPIEAYIGGYDIPGVGGLSIYLKLDISGSIQVIQKFHMKLGMKVGINKLVPYKGPIFKVQDKGSALNAEVTSKLYLEAKFGLYGQAMPIKGYLFGQVGFMANVRYKTYVDLDGNCVHFGGHLFAVFGARADFSLLGAEESFIAEKEVYNEQNSPVKLAFHYEDGVKVSQCTREDETVAQVTGDPSVIADSGYTTSPGSGYSGSGLASGSSKGQNSSGEPITIYKYTLDENNNATITGYAGNVSTLSIPITIDGYPVVAIGSSAFANRTELRNVIIPDCVTSIGYRAFNGCSNLDSVQLPAGLKKIGDQAFRNCTDLTYIRIPKTLTSVVVNSGNSLTGVFAGCSSLTTATLENGITVIPEGLFTKATALKSIVIPDSVKTIKRRAFNGCSALASVKLPATLETIGDLSFGYCTSLKEIKIPKTVQYFDYIYAQGESDGVFYGCTKLTNIELEYGITHIPVGIYVGTSAVATTVIPDTVTYIRDKAFKEANGLKTLEIPGSVTGIGEEAFYKCTGLESIMLPDSVKIIEKRAFNGCSSLASVKLPTTLETIGDLSFGYCTSLKEIKIPKTVQYFDNIYAQGESDGVFRGCTKLTNIELEYGITHIPVGVYVGTSAVATTVIPDTVTYIRDKAFKNATGLKTLEIPGSVTGIGEEAFYYCTGLESIILPDSVKIIEKYAFYNCISLVDVALPNKLTTIGDLSFGYCTSLEEIKIPKTVTSFDNIYARDASDGVFKGCKKLTKIELEDGLPAILIGMFVNTPAVKEVVIPESVKTIPYRAFHGATGLQTIVIPETVASIGTEAFYGCTGLQSVTWPSSLTSIPSYTFYGCTALNTIKLPENLKTINEYAFYNCDSLISFTLPDTVTTMGQYAFYDCDGLTQIRLSEKLKSIPTYGFYGCDALTEIAIPNTVTAINEYAFYSCDLLSAVTIPGTVKTIGNYAFYNCDSMSSIVIPYGVTSIGNSCFYDCDALVSVDMANSVTSMGTGVFQHCDLLKDVKLSRNLTIIPSGTFKECAELEQIVIPYFVTKIDANAFNSSPKLTKVVVHDKLATITTSAFSYPDRTVFYGPTGSTAETWCADNGYTFNENTVTAAKVTVRDSALTIPKGQTKVLDFTIDPADFGDTITFRSSNTSVVTVDETGKLTAVAPGTATIRINVGSASASCKVTVTQAVTKITLDKKTLALDVPNTYQLVATITPTDASNKVLTWTSSNESAATVDENGLITAVGNGTAVITATATDGSGISASCTVTVTDPTNIPVSGISLDKTSLSLEALETYRLTATVSPADAANKNLRWTSSNEAVATVDQNGNITAVAKGTAVITAAATDKSGVTAACTVTVTNTAYVVTDAANLESPHNYPLNCTDFWLYTIPGAEKLMVTFDQRTYVEDEFDFLLVFDGEGKQVGKYSGDQLAGVTLEIPGDTVKIQLQSDDIGTDWGFKVTEVKAKKPIETIATGWSGATQWTLTSDGTLTVYGTGNMKDYGWVGGQPWAKYAAQITAVVIEEGVTKVGSGAFKDMTALESVTLPASGLKTIGIAAFYGCTALKKITIPEGIYTIWEYTFKNCSAMESVKLPKTLIKIDQGAFEACTSLAELYLPTNVEIIGGWSFKGCTAMTRVDMQWSDVTRIRPGAFKNCTALTEIILPVNIQILGDSCFYGIGATTFTVPDTVTVIEDWCFARSALKEIIFEGNAPTIGQGAFNKITLTAYYPKGNATWTAEILQNYGGTVTWANS